MFFMKLIVKNMKENIATTKRLAQYKWLCLVLLVEKKVKARRTNKIVPVMSSLSGPWTDNFLKKKWEEVVRDKVSLLVKGQVRPNMGKSKGSAHGLKGIKKLLNIFPSDSS